MDPTTLPPLARLCEAPGCEEGQVDRAYCDLRGDPIEPARWRECRECLGTGQLHVNCAVCDVLTPWSLTVPDPESGEALCPDCIANEEDFHVAH